MDARTEIRTQVLPCGKDTLLPIAIYASPLLKIHHALFFAHKVCISQLYDSYTVCLTKICITSKIQSSLACLFTCMNFFNENVEQSLSDFCSLLMVLISRKIPEN
jgi:hypothetical protein